MAIINTSLNYLISLFQVHYYLAYLILFLASFLETIIGLGFILYGEIFFLAAAILAGIGDLNIWIVALASILGGLLGDNFGYWLGRKYGIGLVSRIFTKKHRFLSLKNYEKSRLFFHKHGKKSIFLGRFTGPVSCIFPFLTGTLKIKYKDFLKYIIPAEIIGISQFLIAGYLFGLSYALFLPKIEKYLFYFILGFAVLSYIVFKIISTEKSSKKEKTIKEPIIEKELGIKNN